MQHQKVIDYIVNWLKNYAKMNGLKGFVLGISGGVDSALSSTLCAKTGFPVWGVKMPIHQNSLENDHANKHLDWLKSNFNNIQSTTIDLTLPFDALVKNLPKSKNQDTNDLALANTRARLRMTTLYHLAGLKGYIVVGTGNKIEDFGIGFYTKYGDGGVDISPIGDLTKTEVFELSEQLHIEESILKANPTDGLFEDSRSDEEQIGATYPELEWAMKQHEKGKTPADFEERKLEVFKIYEHRHRVNKHKWKPIPVCEIPPELK